MKYLVCVKQVPKFTKIGLDPQTHNLIREGMRMQTNPADENAITLAAKLREQTGGEITVLSMGIDSAIETLKECIVRGADKGYLLTDRLLKGSDTLATSYALSCAIKHLGEFDVVITGSKAEDGDTGQVGPEIGEFLGINQISYVKDAEYKDGKIVAVRQLSTGVEKVSSNAPVLLTVLKGSNEPQKVTKAQIEKVSDDLVKSLSAQDVNAEENRLGQDGSATVVSGLIDLERKSLGNDITGKTAEESVENILAVLTENKFVGR